MWRSWYSLFSILSPAFAGWCPSSPLGQYSFWASPGSHKNFFPVHHIAWGKIYSNCSKDLQTKNNSLKIFILRPVFQLNLQPGTSRNLLAGHIGSHHNEPSAWCQGAFSDIWRGGSSPHLQSDSLECLSPGADRKVPDNNHLWLKVLRGGLKLWDPLGILIVTWLAEESIHHTLKFRALCKPNSVPSRILGVKVASGWPITTNFPSVHPDLPCPELFHWEERGRHKPRMLTWVPGVW